jgi:hypothetical protein
MEPNEKNSGDPPYDPSKPGDVEHDAGTGTNPDNRTSETTERPINSGTQADDEQ